ncbi:MAG: hypothetical protein NVS3B19_03270 [Ginsengibacter sp.]
MTIPVIIHKDARIDILEKKQLELNTAYLKAVSRSAMGYRLMVLSTNDRALAMKTRTDLLQKFPEQKNYMIYQAPYVKIRFGNFRTRDEADIYRKQISKMLNGASIYLIEDRIEVSGKDPIEP